MSFNQKHICTIRTFCSHMVMQWVYYLNYKKMYIIFFNIFSDFAFLFKLIKRKLKLNFKCLFFMYICLVQFDIFFLISCVKKKCYLKYYRGFIYFHCFHYSRKWEFRWHFNSWFLYMLITSPLSHGFSLCTRWWTI